MYYFKVKYLSTVKYNMNTSVCEIHGVKGTKETLLKSMIVPYRSFERSEKLMQELSDFVNNSSYNYDTIVCYRRSEGGSYMRFIISKLVDNKQRIIQNMMGPKIAGEDIE
jgi:hypothetical protein